MGVAEGEGAAWLPSGCASAASCRHSQTNAWHRVNAFQQVPPHHWSSLQHTKLQSCWDVLLPCFSSVLISSMNYKSSKHLVSQRSAQEDRLPFQTPRQSLPLQQPQRVKGMVGAYKGWAL
eukprot:scaffold123109_cov18-Tisochrysis_lutea.AAC.1